MKSINKILAIAICPLLFNSCASDYLDTYPTDKLDPEVLYQDETYSEYAINGLAKIMKDKYTSNIFDGAYFNGEGTVKLFYGDYQGADMYVPRANLYTVCNGNSRVVTTSTWNSYMWNYYYKLIYNANAIIKYANPEKSKQFKYIYAQALTYRAYAYMQLLQLYSVRWCDSENGSADGVVLRLEPTSESLPLSSMKDCYGQIYKDLDAAIGYYQASGLTRASNENHKVNIDAAYATYARTALTREDWENAAKYAALARANYPLMSTDDYKKGFSTVNKEWIWSIYDDAEESLGSSSLAARLAYNSSSTLVCTYPHCISKELFNQIPATDIRKSLFLDPGELSYTISTATGNGRAGTELKKLAFQLYPDMNSKATPYAYMSFKFKATDGAYTMPFNLFRSSEMYLIEAEADCHLTPAKETEAQQLLKELVHDSERDTEYTCEKVGQDLLDEVKFQRRIELWGEGFSFFDFKRRKDTVVRKSEPDGNFIAGKTAVTLAPTVYNNWTWVLPDAETNFNDYIK